jgi:transcriptional regulator with XRE-family HTH domain
MTNFVIVRKQVNKPFVIAFGNNLRKLRLSKKISMQNLAYAINVEYSQISRIELGKINTSISTANDIANALEIPVSELFNFEII